MLKVESILSAASVESFNSLTGLEEWSTTAAGLQATPTAAAA
jgi:hypothetical protein